MSISFRDFATRIHGLFPLAVCSCRFLADQGLWAEFRGGGIGPPIQVRGRYGIGEGVFDAVIPGGEALLLLLELNQVETNRQLALFGSSDILPVGAPVLRRL